MPLDKIPLQKGNYKMILACEYQKGPVGNPEGAARLGWLFTDCNRSYTNAGLISTCYISQSKESVIVERKENQ